ncbi:type IV toxin-antitoxin system AbiEi family antitoxin domain-containing protein [Kribbella deserti]|uniref:Type IV toxin-antitoxin system AbiEi family antitoxin domain-containing protein n=1 Tax=Kribbella deserti TaxID=1926257 RepID=A0ABV6QHU1_9ACTN
MNPQLRALAARQGNVFSRAQALACGYSDDQIKYLVANRSWRRIRHGQFAEAVDRTHLPPWGRRAAEHLEAVHALLNSLTPESVAISHQSALLLHQLPVFGLDVSTVHVTKLNRRIQAMPGVSCHRGDLTAPDLMTVDGVLMTTPARALVETGCRAPFETTVVAADAALGRGKAQPQELERLLKDTVFWPGSPTMRAAMRFADGRSESVGESRLRVLMAAQGLPEPELQVEFADAMGPFARVDFYFPEFRTVVEFDGLVKYGDAAAEVVMREKAREDRLRALGLEVVRVTWADLSSPEALAERIRAAFARYRDSSLAGRHAS